MKLRAADLFCGAGGSSIGAYLTGEVEIVCAINHWSRAIETHSRNLPGAKHFQSRIDQVSPTECDPIDLLLCSPECTNFTSARGNRERSESSRCLAWNVLPWIEHHHPAWVVIENVPEFQQWGPMRDGKPIKERAGETFRAWTQAIETYDYQVDFRILNAADYGAATSRSRLIVIARRGDLPPVFPVPLTGRHRSFASVMDWSIPCPSINARKRPLCNATLMNLARGRERFGNSKWIQAYYGNATFTPITRPLPTITTRDRFALCDATSGEIGLRMLTVKELKAAQGFPDSYVICGTREEQVKQIGNSVPPPLAFAVVKALLSA